MEISDARCHEIPTVCLRQSGTINAAPKKKHTAPRNLSPVVSKYMAYDISRKLREFGWLVPAYTMPPNREDLVVLRVVVRNGFSHDMAELFLSDLKTAIDWLDHLDGKLPLEQQPEAFSH